MAAQIRKPDLNAPRYRAKRTNIVNAQFCEEFRQEYPRFAHLTNEQIKDIIKGVNGMIWQTAIAERDGVELPEQLGYIFIGSCPAKRTPNKDYKTSVELQRLIQHRNWASADYLAKIFYTNFGSKYRFQFSSLWGFKPARQFSRSVGQTYPDQYLKYIIVENRKRINELFRRHAYRMKMNELDKKTLENYDPFEID